MTMQATTPRGTVLTARDGESATSFAIRCIKAEVWEEGYASGFSVAMRQMSDEPNAPATPNPYA